jgi:hypothetical protein
LNIITLRLFLLLILIPVFSSHAQIKTEYYSIADSIISHSLSEQKGYSWLSELCSIGPRLSGSENLNKAVEWSRKKIESLGLEAWLQPVMVPHWERGRFESAEIVSPGAGKKLVIAALGGSVNTPAEGITAGIIEVKNFVELEKRKDEVKGKIVFFNHPLNPSWTSPFEGYEDAVQFRSRGAMEAIKYGAAGVLIRSITSRHDNVPHTGAMRKYDPAYAKIPDAALGYKDADYLEAELKKNPSLQINIKLDCMTFPDVLSYNIITEIKGSKYPDEIVLVGGHIDSWDKGTGAHDDGAGIMQCLEVLDLFKRLNIKPSRTIRCVIFANEENGVRGAQAYAKYSDSLSVKHIAAIESDRGAFTPRAFEFDADSIHKSKVLEGLNAMLPVLKKAGIEWVKEGDGGVDISFINNVNAHIGYVPDEQRYFDVHHSDNDVYEAVNPREMQLGTAAIAIITYLISENGL